MPRRSTRSPSPRRNRRSSSPAPPRDNAHAYHRAFHVITGIAAVPLSLGYIWLLSWRVYGSINLDSAPEIVSDNNTGAQNALIVLVIALTGTCYVSWKIWEHDIGRGLVDMKSSFGIWAAGLVWKQCQLGKGREATTAHYLEREARVQGAAREDLLCIPGFTVPAAAMADLIKGLDAPANFRIVVMELPLHGRNAGQFDGASYPQFVDILLYVRRFVSALELGHGARLNILGYSLGGAVATQYLADHADEVNKAILLTPGLPELLTDKFAALVDPREAHAWETFEECKHFFEIRAPHHTAPHHSALRRTAPHRTARSTASSANAIHPVFTPPHSTHSLHCPRAVFFENKHRLYPVFPAARRPMWSTRGWSENESVCSARAGPSSHSACSLTPSTRQCSAQLASG